MRISKGFFTVLLSALLFYGCSGSNSGDIFSPVRAQVPLASLTADIVIMDDFPDCENNWIEVGTDPVSFTDCAGNAVNLTGMRITYEATDIWGGVEMISAPGPGPAQKAQYKITLITEESTSNRAIPLVIKEVFPDVYTVGDSFSLFAAGPELPFFRGHYTNDMFCEEFIRDDRVTSVFYPEILAPTPDDLAVIDHMELELDVPSGDQILVDGSTITGSFAFLARMEYPEQFGPDGAAFAHVTGCFEIDVVGLQKLR